MKKKLLRVCTFIIIALLTATITYHCKCGGEWTDKPFNYDAYCTTTNIFAKGELLKEANILSGKVIEIHCYVDDHWVTTIDCGYPGLNDVDVYMGKKDLRQIEIGDTITVRGEIRVTGKTTYSENDINVDIGHMCQFIPFTWNAQLIRVIHTESESAVFLPSVDLP